MPILSSTPARSTEPPVGASTWASGSQVWKGTIGTFTANPAMRARKIAISAAGGSGWARMESVRLSMSNVTVPVCEVFQSTIARSPRKVSRLPANV